jgi:hypothetical protein
MAALKKRVEDLRLAAAQREVRSTPRLRMKFFTTRIAKI